MAERKRFRGFYALEKIVSEALQWQVDNGALELEEGTVVSDLQESSPFTISVRENGSKNGTSRYLTTLGENCELQESNGEMIKKMLGVDKHVLDERLRGAMNTRR